VTSTARPKVVLDTNIVLDLFVYEDPATPVLLEALVQKQVQWLATAHMREELRRVLDYAHILKRREQRGLSVQTVLDQFDAFAQLQTPAPKAPYVCKDTDDQCFIDLAAAHQAVLVSKDKQVLKLTNRLKRLGVDVVKIWSPAPS
jgi:putative PIN family toxin of toxin-antitoxin system